MISKEDKIKKYYLLVLAFTTGLTIMAVEISAARLIAPYFGTSTFVWTNIIGIIMLALAIGYYLGGKFADKNPNLKFILKAILLACLLLMIIPFVTKDLVSFIVNSVITYEGSTVLIFGGSLMSITVLFFVPVVLLGLVSPYIIKLLSLIDPNIGKDAGLVFSISTFGSILGTFLPVLVFIPYLGTRKTIIFFALVLLFVVLLGLLKHKWLLLLFVLAVPFMYLNMTSIRANATTVMETESAYQYIQVQDHENFRYLLLNEGLGISSIYNLEPDNVMTGFYYDYYNLLPYISGNHQQQDILILGLAGGVISTQLDHYFAKDYDLRIDGVEIDSEVIETAQEYFDLDNPSLSIYNLDARNFVNYSDKKYNSVVIDAYSIQHYVPFHLTTLEFFTSLKHILKPQGVAAMNINVTSLDSQLLKTITNTMLKVFDHVYLIQEKDDDWNYMVIGTDYEVNWQNLKTLNSHNELEGIIEKAINRNIKAQYDYKFDYLTDDKAPIEFMTEWMVMKYLYENTK
jgi:spermidine synthase